MKEEKKEVKKTMVKLIHKGISDPVEFEISHANKILNMEKNGGWKLNDSNFILDKDGNITRPTKGNNKAE